MGTEENRVEGCASVRTVGREGALGQRSGWAILIGLVLIIVSRTTGAQTSPPAYDELFAKAARQGTLRVIVEVLPEGSAPYTREAITQAQDRVLQELVGTNHRVLRRFTTIPFLGLAVSADALRRLAGSLFVGGIREDTMLRPQGFRATP
jgi:hypothetical protein